jgi:hypothetical protein
MANKTMRTFLLTILVVQMLSCGTILYPERRGQAAGKYDADVVFLDAAGLLLFLVPGVIAFAVDFATGAIYLPPGEKSKIMERLGRVQKIEFDPANRDLKSIARIIEKETGITFDSRAIQVDETSGCRDDVEACVWRLNYEIASGGRPMSLLPVEPTS